MEYIKIFTVWQGDRGVNEEEVKVVNVCRPSRRWRFVGEFK